MNQKFLVSAPDKIDFKILKKVRNQEILIFDIKN